MTIDPNATYGRLLDAKLVNLSAELIQPLATIVTWLRLEPLPHSADLAPGLAAETADPLWFLARQWQFAEFAGEDAGSPIVVQLAGEQARLSRYRPGPVPHGQPNADGALDYSHLTTPLEVAVERESVRETHPRLAAEAGEHLLRLLSAAGIADGRARLRASYGLTLAPNPDQPDTQPTDPRAAIWRTLFAGRALDGRALAAALAPQLQSDGTLSAVPAELGLDDTDAARSACASWLRWYGQHVSEPDAAVGSAWVPERQEYALTLAAQLSDRSAVLAAEEYTDGRLDWYDFDADDAPQFGAADPAIPSEPVTLRPLLPTAVRYPGMPADRYWEFEDARVSFGQVEAGPTDLGRLLLAEYALVYGNDWFVIPVELPVGSLFRVSALTVRDTFGVTANVGPARNLDGSRWTMFTLTNQPGGLADLFFLAPTLPERLEGDPLEQVALFRDEMANMAWAVERFVQGASGEPRDRRMEPSAPGVYQRIPGEQITAALIYRLATPVPEQWLPFVPVPDAPNMPAANFAIHLERRALLRTLLDGSQQTVQPQGRLLRTDLRRAVEDEPPLHLNEEEIPRAGAVVARSFQYARWLDGRRFLWAGRSKRVGRGEGASGLRYDIAPYHKS